MDAFAELFASGALFQSGDSRGSSSSFAAVFGRFSGFSTGNRRASSESGEHARGSQVRRSTARSTRLSNLESTTRGSMARGSHARASTAHEIFSSRDSTATNINIIPSPDTGNDAGRQSSAHARGSTLAQRHATLSSGDNQHPRGSTLSHRLSAISSGSGQHDGKRKSERYSTISTGSAAGRSRYSTMSVGSTQGGDGLKSSLKPNQFFKILFVVSFILAA